MPSESIIKSKSKVFAIKAIRLYAYLTDERHEFVLAKQFLRSATSIGANVTEAQCAISTKDFVAKMYVAFKECAETIYWLDLLYETNYIDSKSYDELILECKELHRILSSITKTTQERINKK